VANLVELSPAAGVVAAGLPVKIGELIAALSNISLVLVAILLLIVLMLVVPSFNNFPVVPSNTAIFSLVAEDGPLTSPDPVEST